MATDKPLSPISYMQSRKMDGLVVDLSGQGLNKLDSTLFSCADTHTLILDSNNIIKLENLEQGTEIKQLSVASNRLVRMMGVSKLRELTLLNLPGNSIGYIEGLKDLPHLQWLNLAGNNLKVMDELNSCVGLQHLDLSDNNISAIGDLTNLTDLKVLHLHGNTITTLRSVPAYLPSKLSSLSVAENEIKDLNEVSYLSSLHSLEQLSVTGNPCVMPTSSLPACDYRPYVVSWCLQLKVLDGYAVSQKEGLKAEWMYSQGKGHGFRPGQHEQLVQYLASVCPLTITSALQSAEDAKLERILNKQRQHQKQLLRLDHRGWLSSASQGPCSAEQQRCDSPERSPAHLTYRAEHVVQVNTWVGTDPSDVSVFYPGFSASRDHDSTFLKLEDVQTDEEKLHGSQLSSESFFLPVTSSAYTPGCSTDCDDNDTDLPIAPPHTHTPAQPARDAKTVRVGQKTSSYNLVISSPVLSSADGSLTPISAERQSDMEGGSNRNCVGGDANQTAAAAALEAATERHCPLDVALEAGTGRQCPRNVAAVRIQAWWRGHWTRLHHPQAKEVRAEIRLRRMQEHIVYLTGELQRVLQQQEEERIQRLVQEEAVKCLWKQLQSLLSWQTAVMEQLKCGSSISSLRPCAPSASADHHTLSHTRSLLPSTPVHSQGHHQGAPQGGSSSKASGNSPELLLAPLEAAAQFKSVENREGDGPRQQHFSAEQNCHTADA